MSVGTKAARLLLNCPGCWVLEGYKYQACLMNNSIRLYSMAGQVGKTLGLRSS